MEGNLVRWTVPASLPCYGDWDFRVDPGTFDLHAAPLLAGLRLLVAGRGRQFGPGRTDEPGYGLYLGHVAGLGWLEDALRRSDLVVWDWPEDLVWPFAPELVYSGSWAEARCPACRAGHQPGAGRVAEWAFGSGLAASGGRRYLCPEGHILYAIGEWDS